MGKRLFVRVRVADFRQDELVEVPGNEKIGTFLPDLVKVLHPPGYQGLFESVSYCLYWEDQLLPEDRSLEDLGVQNSDVLTLRLEEVHATKESQQCDAVKASAGVKTMPFGSLPPAPQISETLSPWDAIEIDRPSLISTSPFGWVFEIGMPPMVIGRPDRGFIPDIDLTDLDKRRNFVASRRHAEIIMVNEQLAIKALKTLNGTFVNGQELLPGKWHILKNNDEIQFGRRGVKVIYRTPLQDEK
ncbi:FHA domain-containing protein [Candidatus Parcubacteria bacterium]|nr:MAG: FHA domain-containing protein [Candidatus Parcubacteria bacterium]